MFRDCTSKFKIITIREFISEEFELTRKNMLRWTNTKNHH